MFSNEPQLNSKISPSDIAELKVVLANNDTIEKKLNVCTYVAALSLLCHLDLSAEHIEVIGEKFVVRLKKGMEISGFVVYGELTNQAAIQFKKEKISVIITPDSDLKINSIALPSFAKIVNAKVYFDDHLDGMLYWPREDRIGKLEAIAADAGVSRTFINRLALSA